MKYITNTEGLSAEQMAFVRKIDDGLDNAVQTVGTAKLQEQLNDLYRKIDPLANAVPNSGGVSTAERKVAADYMRAVIKGDTGLVRNIIEKETIWPSHVLHTGGNEEIDAGSMAQGGYLIPDLLHTEIARLIEEGGVARKEMRYMPFGGPGNSRRHPAESAAPSVAWTDEGEVKTKTKPTIGQVVQELKKLAAITILTDEIIEDSAVDLISYLAQRFADVMAAEEDNQFFVGTGNPWTGLINAVGIIPAVMQAGMGRNDLTPSHFLALKYSLSTNARRGGKFYMHPEIWAALRSYRSSAVATADHEGHYLVQSPVDGTPPLLWGSPVVETDAMPDWDDVNDVDEPVAIYGNLQRTCVYGDKAGTRVKILDQATVTDEQGATINLAERDMTAVRVMRRVGYAPILPAGIAVLHTGPIS